MRWTQLGCLFFCNQIRIGIAFIQFVFVELLAVSLIWVHDDMLPTLAAVENVIR